MPDKERRAAVGIPQVIQTPVRLKIFSEFVQESILGKEAKARPALDDFNTFADFAKALNPQEKRRRIDNANIQIVKLARQAMKTFRRAS